jgi:hypothetical protein
LKEKLLVYPDPNPTGASTKTKPQRIYVVDEVYQLCATCSGYFAESTKHDCSSAVTKPVTSPSPVSPIIEKLTEKGDSIIDGMLVAVQSFLSRWSEATNLSGDQGCLATFYLKSKDATINNSSKIGYVRFRNFEILENLSIRHKWVEQGLERRIEEYMGFKAGVEGHGIRWQFRVKTSFDSYDWFRIDFELLR